MSPGIIVKSAKNLRIIETSLQYLAEIEDHLNVTIQQVGSDIKVPLSEFDGKVTYGEKRMAMGEYYSNIYVMFLSARQC